MLKLFILLLGLFLSAESYANTSDENTKSDKTTIDFFNEIKHWFAKIFANKPSEKSQSIKKTIKFDASKGLPDVDYVVVNKADRKMYMKKTGKTVWEFDIALGTKPVGHKTREGDLKTPEGLYRLGFKNIDSAYYKSIKISYPNVMDKKQARGRRQRPGGAIVVHGMPNNWKNDAELISVRGKDWTEGCIGLKNKDMDAFWRMVKNPEMFIKINP